VNKGGRVLPVRLTAQSVALIIKAHAKRVGLDPRSFAGHSLRSGFLTSAAKRGASIFKMMDVSRHRSIDTLRGYVRDADSFRHHAGLGYSDCSRQLPQIKQIPTICYRPPTN
jgi:integrase